MIDVKLVKIENIDRKRVLFPDGSNNKDDVGKLYCDPEVIIIRNDDGKKVFNELIRYFNYKEQGAEPLGDIKYPFYILTMTVVTSRLHFGSWKYFANIFDLTEVVRTESMEDDFEEFD